MTENRRWWMLSLESKLPLMVGGLLFVVIGALTLASYLVATDAERSSAAVRLERDAGLVATRLHTGTRGTILPGRALAAHPDIQAFLASPGDRALGQAAERALVYRGAGPEIVLVTELLDAAGNRLLSVGRTQTGTPRLAVGELAQAERTGVGPLSEVDGIPAFPAIAAVEAGGVRVGWIVIWWHLVANIRLESGAVYLGNRVGPVWTDLRGIVSPPPFDVSTSASPFRYSRAGVLQLVAAAPIPETPWLVLVEAPENPILAPTRRYVARVAVFALSLFMVACLGVWFMSRRITRPLRRLTDAAAAISAGDYSIQVSQSGHDEISRLAGTFNHMGQRIQDAQRRVEEQAFQYQMLFERNPSPMWVFDRQTLRFLAVNNAACHTYGYTLDEFLNLTIQDIRPAEDIPRLLDDLAQSHKGLDFAGSWVHRKKDGTSIAVEITSHDLPFQGRNATLVLAKDVTDRERAEHALQSAHERLRAIVDEAPVAVYSLDTEGIVRSWNPAAERIFGWSADEAIGQPLQTIPVEARREPAVRIQEVAAGHLLKGAELTRLRKDGSTVSVRIYAAPLHDAAGSVVGIMVVAADTTELRRLELQYRQAQKMEAVGRLAGGIAHDFNNLLTVILGESEMALQDMSATDGNRPTLEEISRAGGRAAQLTRQLLAFSRQQIVELTVFDLNDLARDMERMLERLIGEHVRMEARLNPDAVLVRADRSQMEQVLINLAVNARDAMPDGGTVTIETSSLHLEEETARAHDLLHAGHYCLLSVIDTGCGMSETVRSHIFEPFFTTKAAGRGTGLGLATCYGIVSQAGGHIEVFSEVGVGTSFKVYLPRAVGQATPSLEGLASATTSGHESVLLVEDQEAVRETTARMLRGLGYQVITARDGEAAIEILNAKGMHVDLLLTDVVLPGINGGELAQRARAGQANLKVLFASGYTGDVAAYKALVDTNSALIQKPFTVAVLGERVRQVLDQ